MIDQVVFHILNFQMECDNLDETIIQYVKLKPSLENLREDLKF